MKIAHENDVTGILEKENKCCVNRQNITYYMTNSFEQGLFECRHL